MRFTTGFALFLALAFLAAWLAQIAAAEVPFDLVTIDNTPPQSPWYKMAGDLNGDGRTDIVVGGQKGPLVVYVNPSWEKITIASGGWEGVRGSIGDIDGDGDADIVTGGVIWFENPGNLDTQWTTHRIDDAIIHDVLLGDVDMDGRMDVIGRNQSAFKGDGNEIFIYRQQPDQSWSKQTLDCPHGEGLKLGDLDADGDPDILIGNFWYENTLGSGRRWVRHSYTNQWAEADAKVEMADINGDGRSDIVLTPAELRNQTYRICWYEAPSDRTASGWTEHVISDSIECVIHALGVGDIDRDGDIDLAIAEMHQGVDPDEVSIVFNSDRGNSWSKQLLSNRGSHDIIVTDIDNDGDLDIFGANHDSPSPLELWRNNLFGPGDRIPGPQPGDVYREYASHNGSYIKQGERDNWRVTNPTVRDERARKFLPNPVLQIEGIDLEGAIRAEALLHRWGGHPGTIGKQIRFNGKDWLTVPELTTTPQGERSEWYYSEDNPIMEIPLEHLKQGVNTYEGMCGSLAKNRWGQWGLYSLIVRVYYDEGLVKKVPRAKIVQPVSGQILHENPRIEIEAESPSGVGRIDVLASYYGYDENGDGRYQDWHQSYFQPRRGAPAVLHDHVATIWRLPYQTTWDTTWTPEQAPKSIKLIVRVLDSQSGLWKVSEAVEDLSLEREGVSVRLFPASNLPNKFGVRNGARKSCFIPVPIGTDLTKAVEARLALRTWNGLDGVHFPMKFNDYELNIDGLNHHYRYNQHPIPVSTLRTGYNTLNLASDTEHHMLEVLWPGPGLLVRFEDP